MPALYLFIAGCLFLVLLYPGRVLYFLHTMKLWLARRRLRRETYDKRKDEILQATADWRQCLTGELAQLHKTDIPKDKATHLRRSLAAAERYLQSVSPDECPQNYKHAKKFSIWAEKTIAEMDRREQR